MASAASTPSISSAEIRVGAAGRQAPVVYIVGDAEPDADLDALARGRSATLARLAVRDWGASLTPWPAPNPFRPGETFAGEADATLRELLGSAIPQIERAHGLKPARRAVCGYSLAGLFALWAFASSGAFEACACLSGSLWYEGLPGRLAGLPFDGRGRFAFLSVGSREKDGRRQAARSVEERMLEVAEVLRRGGCRVETATGPGNHFQHVQERYEKGLAALDLALAQKAP